MTYTHHYRHCPWIYSCAWRLLRAKTTKTLGKQSFSRDLSASLSTTAFFIKNLIWSISWWLVVMDFCDIIQLYLKKACWDMRVVHYGHTCIHNVTKHYPLQHTNEEWCPFHLQKLQHSCAIKDKHTKSPIQMQGSNSKWLHLQWHDGNEVLNYRPWIIQLSLAVSEAMASAAPVCTTPSSSLSQSPAAAVLRACYHTSTQSRHGLAGSHRLSHTGQKCLPNAINVNVNVVSTLWCLHSEKMPIPPKRCRHALP